MSRHHLSRKAFTLIEMLAVVLIILALAGVTVGIASYVSNWAKRSRTQAEITALELAIESFKLDNGYYPTSAICRLSYQPYRVQTNSWMLYLQLTTGPKKYMTFSSDQIATEKASGATYIVDAWGSPIVYYCPGSNVTFQAFSYSESGDAAVYAPNTYYWTEGGQINVLSFDLFSYGPDKITYIPNVPSSDPWGKNTATADDITNWKR